MKHPTEHFCDNSECELHQTMVPVGKSLSFLQNFTTTHKEGVRFTLGLMLSGMEVTVHLCQRCYNARRLKSYVAMAPEGVYGEVESLCFNPVCKFHNKMVFVADKSVDYHFIPKLKAADFDVGDGPVYTKTTSKTLWRTPWHVQCKDQATHMRAVTCSICTKALQEFGEEFVYQGVIDNDT